MGAPPRRVLVVVPTHQEVENVDALVEGEINAERLETLRELGYAE